MHGQTPPVNVSCTCCLFSAKKASIWQILAENKHSTVSAAARNNRIRSRKRYPRQSQNRPLLIGEQDPGLFPPALVSGPWTRRNAGDKTAAGRRPQNRGTTLTQQGARRTAGAWFSARNSGQRAASGRRRRTERRAGYDHGRTACPDLYEDF